MSVTNDREQVFFSFTFLYLIIMCQHQLGQRMQILICPLSGFYGACLYLISESFENVNFNPARKPILHCRLIILKCKSLELECTRSYD